MLVRSDPHSCFQIFWVDPSRVALAVALGRQWFRSQRPEIVLPRSRIRRIALEAIAPLGYIPARLPDL